MVEQGMRRTAAPNYRSDCPFAAEKVSSCLDLVREGENERKQTDFESQSNIQGRQKEDPLRK